MSGDSGAASDPVPSPADLDRAKAELVRDVIRDDGKKRGEEIMANSERGTAIWQDGARMFALACQLDQAVAAVVSLTEHADTLQAEHRDLTHRLGFGNNITEPQADNDTIVKWYDERSNEAAEWRESQSWRNDCYDAGHSDDEDCYEHDPSLKLIAVVARASAAEAALAEVRAIHQPTYEPDGLSLCLACGDGTGSEDWPCPTFNATDVGDAAAAVSGVPAQPKETP